MERPVTLAKMFFLLKKKNQDHEMKANIKIF